MTQRTIDPDVLQALVGQAVGDFGWVLNAALVVVGDRLGLYRALAEGGSATSTELAERTGTVERNVREWLSAQAAAGFVTYDGPAADGDRWSLTPEQEEAFTNESSPAFLCGGFQVMTAAAKADEKITAAFRHGVHRLRLSRAVDRGCSGRSSDSRCGRTCIVRRRFGRSIPRI